MAGGALPAGPFDARLLPTTLLRNAVPRRLETLADRVMSLLREGLPQV